MTSNLFLYSHQPGKPVLECLASFSDNNKPSLTDDWAEDEWEWEEEEETEEPPADAPGKAQITISENLVTIDRSKVDWSDDEFEEEEEEAHIPAPPPPPAPPVPPPPPPPGPGALQDKKVSSMKSEKIEQLKKKPAKRPDWSDLMKEIGQFRGSCHGLLKKIVCDDRSKPVLSKELTKVKGVVSICQPFILSLNLEKCFKNSFLVCL